MQDKILRVRGQYSSLLRVREKTSFALGSTKDQKNGIKSNLILIVDIMLVHNQTILVHTELK